jgi:hypothetical protein
MFVRSYIGVSVSNRLLSLFPTSLYFSTFTFFFLRSYKQEYRLCATLSAILIHFPYPSLLPTFFSSSRPLHLSFFPPPNCFGTTTPITILHLYACYSTHCACRVIPCLTSRSLSLPTPKRLFSLVHTFRHAVRSRPRAFCLFHSLPSVIAFLLFYSCLLSILAILR